jgi:flavin reductase (DIM6/NTAB) family NADH-FMN oxidoreductase RutF
MNEASFGYGPDVSEWRAAGFSMAPSVDVKPPRVEQSLVQFECKLFQVVKHGKGSGAANYVIGEVVRMHVNKSIWSTKGVELERLRLLARMGGPNYLDADGLEIFEMQRPAGPVPEES